MSIFGVSRTEEERQGTVAHAHNSSGFLHFHIDEITASASYILIDISDTDFHNHVETYLVHLDKIFYRVDASVNASYTLRMWTISDVTSVDCTRHMFWSESGQRSTGLNLTGEEDFHPYGPLLKAGGFASTMVEENYEGYNSSTPLLSSSSMVTPVKIPAENDVIFEFVMNNSNAIEFHMNFCYHTHSKFHP